MLNEDGTEVDDEGGTDVLGEDELEGASLDSKEHQNINVFFTQKLS